MPSSGTITFTSFVSTPSVYRNVVWSMVTWRRRPVRGTPSSSITANWGNEIFSLSFTSWQQQIGCSGFFWQVDSNITDPTVHLSHIPQYTTLEQNCAYCIVGYWTGALWGWSIWLTFVTTVSVDNKGMSCQCFSQILKIETPWFYREIFTN